MIIGFVSHSDTTKVPAALQAAQSVMVVQFLYHH